MSLLGCVLWLAILVAGPSAQAHTADKTMRRSLVLHLEDGGLRLYVRTPGPFVFADNIAQMLADGQQMKGPFLRLERPIQRKRYRIQRKAVTANPQQFRARLAKVFTVRQHDRDLTLRVLDFRLFRHADETPFGTPEDARISMSRETRPVNPWLRSSIIEVVYAIDPLTPDGPLTVASAMPIFEMGKGYGLENQIFDARFPDSIPLSIDGHLVDPVLLDGSRSSAFLSFVGQGVLHILEGLDHVLFVLCLAIGVTSTRRLFWMVTGFSVGHSATLIAGFLGYTPQVSWFAPAVEALIAASIIYAAWAAYRGDGASTVATALFGLLHGFGFSFVLGAILGPQAEGLIPSLLAFNLGVEAGQLVIIAAALSILWIVNRVNSSWLPPVRNITLASCTVMAGYWVVERTLTLV